MDRKPLDLHPEGKDLKIRFARLYSDIFSPPSVYAMFAFVIALSQLPWVTGFLHAALFGAFTSLLPMIYILRQLKIGKIRDIHLSQPGQRTAPYLLSAFGSLVAYLVLRLVGSAPLFLNFIITVIIGLLALALINTRWLISAHTASITAVTAFAGFTFGTPTGLAISPLILSTILIRYYLKRHTFAELLSGVFLGIIIVSGAGVFGFFQE